MGSFASASDIPVLLVYVTVIVALTVGVCITLRRIIERKSRTFALFTCCLFVPMLEFIAGFALLALSPEGPPPNDGPAMAVMGLLMLSAFTLPVVIGASLITFAVMNWKVR